WHAQIPPRKCVLGDTLPNVPIRFAKTSRDRRRENDSGCPSGKLWGALVFAAWGVISRSSSRLPVWKRLLLAAGALAAFSSESAWGRVSEPRPEVPAPVPRPGPRPPRRAEPAPRRAAPSRSAAPAPAPAAPAPVPAVTTPSPFQFVAPTPVTGLG